MLAIVHSVSADSPSLLYLGEFGGAGVHIFFVISGFIMVYTSFQKESGNFSSPNFILKRFIRIFPIYWIYAAASLIVYRSFYEGYSRSLSEIIGSILLLPSYSSMLIPQGWTLSFELYFYICFACFMLCGLFSGLLTMTLFFLTSVTVGLFFPFDNAGFHLVTNSLLLEFLIGAWTGYFFVKGSKLGATLSNGLLVIALAGFVGSFAFGYNRLPTVLTLGVPSALLIAGSVFKERCGNLPRLAQRLSFLGDSSYSLYLTHWLLISVLPKAFFMPFANPVYFLPFCVAYTLLSIVIAIVLYELLERRLVRSLQAIVKHTKDKGKSSRAQISSQTQR
jgi:exopolysaccharide production protein ExoZ